MKKYFWWFFLAAFILAIIVDHNRTVGGQSSSEAATATAPVAAHANPAIDDSECTPAKIKIRGMRGITEDGGFAVITGMIHNGCNQPYGVQLKVALFDKDGTVVDDDDPWPASVSNIPAHSDFPFRTMLEPHGDWTKFSVGVMDIKQW